MLPMLMLATLLATAQVPQAVEEPDGSRTLGVVPPFHAEPAPPYWLRAASHALAALDCKHYAYEVYTDGKGVWLVRYVSFPEGDEAFRELEQAFAFTTERKQKPKEIKTPELTLSPRSVVWAGKTYQLVDRRDLLRP